MKALIILFDSELRDEMFSLLSLSEVVNYTHFVGLHGSGNQGRKEGTITWPGTNEMIFLILNDSQLDVLKNNIEEYKQNKEGNPGFLFLNWNLNEVLV